MAAMQPVDQFRQQLMTDATQVRRVLT